MKEKIIDKNKIPDVNPKSYVKGIMNMTIGDFEKAFDIDLLNVKSEEVEDKLEKIYLKAKLYETKAWTKRNITQWQELLEKEMSQQEKDELKMLEAHIYGEEK